MNTAHENLQREWQRKKQKAKVTQAQAASKLGWTQSAFSQYLNGTTKLNPSAVIKLAGYLDVQPCDIDPELKVISSVYCPVCNTYIKT